MKTFEIIAGTYEEFLLGYDFFNSEGRLAQSFASHDHTASIRSLTTSSHYVASGAADDRIIIYDFKLRKEHFMLSHHKSTINCLEFTPNYSHLVSGSQDGLLSITRVGNWQVEKLWDKAHKGFQIIDLAIHPSGKLALTLGEDGALRTWNLVKGRQAYAINLKTKCKDVKNLFKICWADDGVRFLLFGGKYTEIWSIEIGGILQVIEHDVKVSSCLWYSNKKLLVGYENGNLCTVKLSSLKKHVYQVHTDRIKVLVKYDEWIVSGSSSGEIKVYNKELEEICKIYTGCRLTSLIIIPPIKVKKEEQNEANKSVISIEDENEIEVQPIKKRKKKQLESNEIIPITETLIKNKSKKKNKIKFTGTS